MMMTAFFHGDSKAISTYEKRMGIEKMFCDLKSGGYNFEITQVSIGYIF